jgi:hypothetical protein
MSLPKQVSLFSQTLPCRADGLKALVYSTDYGRRVEAVLWKEMADLNTATPVVLQGMPQVNGVATGFIEDALVACEYEAGAGLRLCEYAISPETTWSPRFTTIFGNSDSNSPAVLKLRNGGFVAIGYRNDSSVTIDTAYRRPTVPPAPDEGALPSQWALHTFFLVPGPVGIPPFSLAMVEGTDGLIYVFMTRDSSHTVKLLRLRVEGAELVEVDYHDSFLAESFTNGILQDGDMSPDGEFPFVAAATDWQNGRILITYNQSRWVYSRDTCETIQTRPVVVAVKPDLSKTLVATIPDPVNRSLTRSPIIILPSGVYVVYCYITEADCLDWQWKLARVSGKGAAIFNMAPSDYTAACALSPDGWMVYKDRANTLVNVDQLPILRSKRDGNTLTLTWPGAGQLEFSKDQKTWAPAPFTSPAVVALGEEQMFFRVRYGS